MQVVKKTSAKGPYAKKSAYTHEGQQYEADIKNGDAITIKNAGEIVTGNFGEQHVFPVATRNGEKNLALNQTSMNNMIDAFGTNTEGWVEKTAIVHMIKAMVSGKLQNVVYLAAEGWEMDEEGNFTPPNTVPNTDVEYPEDYEEPTI